MSRLWVLFLGLALVPLAWSGAKATPPPASCRSHPKLSGECFTMHGQLSRFNGTPSARLLVRDAQDAGRVLGVSEGRFALEGYANLPAELASRSDFETDLSGDFTVCPFTDDSPGVMRLVCVESAEHVVETRPSGPQRSSKGGG